jgi:hypothetical protein
MRISFAAALLLFLAAGNANAFVQTKFASEDMAQGHCPGGIVVWLALPGNSYVRKGDARYGATQRGAYICEHDAIAAGNRLAY